MVHRTLDHRGIIRDDGCEYKGVVTQSGLLPGLPPDLNRRTAYLVEAGEDMSGTIVNWRQVLHRLMSDFLSGNALVEPKTNPNTGVEICANSYCELQSLCRIGELKSRLKTSREGNPQEDSA